MERAFDISGNPTFNAPFTVNVNVNHPDNAENRKEVSCRSEEYQVDYVSVQTADEESYNYHVKDQNCYRITNYPKGRVLLINNEFPGDSRHRKGASVDVRVMYELWDQMGCEVVIAKDLTTEKMLEATENFVNGNWSKSDFCVVIIMSHGSNDDLIVGIRHEEMAVKEIIDKIKQSKPLKGKPKVILFQMCRGNKMQKDQADSVPCADANIKSKTDDDVTKSGEGSTYNGLKHLENCASSAEYSRSTSTDAFSTESNSWVMSMLNEVLNNGRILGANIDEADEAAEEYVSETPDVMLAFSTQPGYAAFRNVNKGSWFIQSIAKVFGRYAATHHVKQLLELVKKDVKESYEVYAPGKKENRAKEEVDGSDTFGKKRFWLFPGFPSSRKEN